MKKVEASYHEVKRPLGNKKKKIKKKSRKGTGHCRGPPAGREKTITPSDLQKNNRGNGENSSY